MSEKVSRTTEKVLGILGGVFGMLGGLFAIFVGSFGEAFNGDSGGLGSLGISAFIFSTLGIIAACLVSSKTKFAGWALVISAIGIVISISMFGVIPGILFLIAGILTLTKKDKKINQEETKTAN
ncbi:MAG: hypothetical protein N4A54_03600 [Peptostreptococcaceae bacterium]|nr:hypothetical protein [Peptostreptococcaceae bacterium]